MDYNKGERRRGGRKEKKKRLKEGYEVWKKERAAGFKETRKEGC